MFCRSRGLVVILTCQRNNDMGRFGLCVGYISKCIAGCLRDLLLSCIQRRIWAPTRLSPLTPSSKCTGNAPPCTGRSVQSALASNYNFGFLHYMYHSFVPFTRISRARSCAKFLSMGDENLCQNCCNVVEQYPHELPAGCI